MRGEEFLTVKNAHAESCDHPPTFRSGDGYLSYFESEHRDQWAFTMDWESGVFFISGGDIGWQDRRIGEEGLKNLVLDMPERMWVLACLHACRLPEVAERVVEAWQEFDERVRKRS